MIIKIIPFEQPIGFFALAVMKASSIIQISEIKRLKFDETIMDSVGGPQRESSDKRVKEISEYAKTLDATFPTPVILAVKKDSYDINGDELFLNDDEKSCYIVDGQHRVLGIDKSGIADMYELPVVFVLDATEEQQALLFAIINGKQRQVSSSLIYELYKVSSNRNPYKTTHEIARAMNAEEKSPFYKKLKMLGKKVSGGETLSQGTFATELIKHISDKPDEDLACARRNCQLIPRPRCVFNSYFLDDEDDIILKIMMNIFNAAKSIFPKEWDDSNCILTKTTGYTGIMKALPELVSYGKKNKDLRQEVFERVFKELKDIMNSAVPPLRFVNDDFYSNASGQTKLRNLIFESIDKLNVKGDQ